MDIIKDLLVVSMRIVTIIPLLLFLTLIMGKRSIGELPVFDFIIVLILGAVVGADIADPKIHHIHTVVAIILIALLQRFVTKVILANRKIGKKLTFEPTIVVHEGKFLDANMKKIRYSLDNVLQMLREKDIFNVSDVHLAIIEANGKLTVHKKTDNSSFAYPVIIEGKIYEDTLQKLNAEKSWLKDQLKQKGIANVENVFYASLNEKKELHISLKDQQSTVLPKLNH